MKGIAGQLSKFSKQEIDQLFQTSKRVIQNDAVTILAAPQSHAFARLLLVTPRTIGNAVKRNLLRRRLKDIFYKEKLYGSLRCDLAIIARKPLISFSFDELKELLEMVAKKIS